MKLGLMARMDEEFGVDTQSRGAPTGPDPRNMAGGYVAPNLDFAGVAAGANQRGGQQLRPDAQHQAFRSRVDNLVNNPHPRVMPGATPPPYQPRLTEAQQERSSLNLGLMGMLAGGASGGPVGALYGALTYGEDWRDQKKYENYLDDMLKEAVPGSHQHQALMARRYDPEAGYAATDAPWNTTSGYAGTWSRVPRNIGGGDVQDYMVHSKTGAKDPWGEAYPRQMPQRPTQLPASSQYTNSEIQSARDFISNLSEEDRAEWQEGNEWGDLPKWKSDMLSQARSRKTDETEGDYLPAAAGILGMLAGGDAMDGDRGDSGAPPVGSDPMATGTGSTGLEAQIEALQRSIQDHSVGRGRAARAGSPRY